MSESPMFLIGYDGSDSARRATDYAVTMGAARAAHLRFVYVHNTLLAAMVPVLTQADQRASDEVEHEIELALKERMSNTDVGWDLVYYRGNPFHVLLEAAEAADAEAIVLGATRRTGPHLSGSLAVNLVKAGRFPVITVP